MSGPKAGDRVMVGPCFVVSPPDVNGRSMLLQKPDENGCTHFRLSGMSPWHPALPALAAFLAEGGGAERLAEALEDAAEHNRTESERRSYNRQEHEGYGRFADECAALAAAIRSAFD